jgi:hypothetical protein
LLDLFTTILVSIVPVSMEPLETLVFTARVSIALLAIVSLSQSATIGYVYTVRPTEIVPRRGLPLLSYRVYNRKSVTGFRSFLYSKLRPGSI